MKGRGSDPVPVSQAISSLVQQGGWQDRLSLARLKAAWADVVGQAIADHSEPSKLVGGVLSVRADPGAWATELALLSRRLTTLADTWFGGGVIREVKVWAGK